MKNFVFVSIILLISFESSVFALECPKAPEQVKKDWEVEVNAAVARIGPIKGPELRTKTKRATEDLLGKLPEAGKIYLEQMMFSAYCSTLRDDKTVKESEKAKLLKEYRKDVMQAVKSTSKKARIATPTKPTNNQPTPEKQQPVTPSINANNSNVVVGPASNVTQNIYHEPIQRSILTDKIPLLKSELSKHNSESIDITCVMGDQEAFSFASQLKKLFESAGWSVHGVNQAIYTVPIKGIIIVIKDKSVEPKAQFIFQLLQYAGLHSHGELDDKVTSIGLVIGAKE